ncbi:MAG: hypothetical protein FWD94_02935 [Treponema sp.]|nr:hypothetical protein [Treponema sp.]
MPLTEWNLEDAQEAWYEEGLEAGREEGREMGLAEIKRETARNALMEGLSPEVICKITGLDMETVAGLRAGA